ncbi:MAG: hypothetical protein LUH82_05140 [Clostridiales bacterium]|nr:hypothetical protein [Clostridiales bacterium]
MTFCLTDINGAQFCPQKIKSYELTSDVSAVCDGLRLYFHSASAVGECAFVSAYNAGGELIFSGICDSQQATAGKDGCEYFIYARGSGAVLADNEAEPCEYNSPTAAQLWHSNARQFGFSCALPEIGTKSSYIVSKGTSCRGAVNDFVSAVYGANIYVTPAGELRAFEESAGVKELCDYPLCSLKYLINRGDVVSRADYKISSDEGYKYHLESTMAAAAGISRRKLYNLSSLPAWQRDVAAKKKISDSLLEYHCVEAEIAGECDLQLCDRVHVKSDMLNLDAQMAVCEIVRCENVNGAKTSVVLKEKTDGEIINYVDKQKI